MLLIIALLLQLTLKNVAYSVLYLRTREAKKKKTLLLFTNYSIAIIIETRLDLIDARVYNMILSIL